MFVEKKKCVQMVFACFSAKLWPWACCLWQTCVNFSKILYITRGQCGIWATLTPAGAGQGLQLYSMGKVQGSPMMEGEKKKDNVVPNLNFPEKPKQEK